MYVLDFNKPYLSLSGEPNKEGGKDNETLNRILGNLLVASSKGDALKFYDWAVKIYNGTLVKVDKSDKKKIRDFIEEHEAMYILCKAQLLNVIDSATEEE